MKRAAAHTGLAPVPVTAGGLYVSLVILAGTLVLVDSIGRLSVDPPGMDWWLLVGLTVLSGTAVLKIPAVSVNFSISDVFTLTCAVVFGPAAGVAAVAVDCLVISYRLSRTRLQVERALFNVAAPPLAMWIAAHLFFAISGAPPRALNALSLERMAPALLLGAGAYFLLNTFAVALAVALHERARVFDVWKAHFGNLWFSFLGGAIGAGFVVFALRHGYGAIVLGLPLLLAAILHFAYRNATGRVEDRLQHLEEVNRLHLSTVESLARAIDAKDSVTHNHIRRVQTCSLMLAKQIGLDDPLQLRALEAAALLHDIGKLAVPEHILNKPGRLTAAEFDRMKTHAAVGAEILAQVEFPYPVVPIVRHHHENWDGTGYPDGLRGSDIPVGARILAVIDCYDALTSDRPYRRALSSHSAFAIIRQRRGTMYDPLVVDAFEAIYPTLEIEASPQVQPAAPAAVGTGMRSETSGALESDTPGPALRIAFDLGTAFAACHDRLAAREALWAQLSRIPRVDALGVYVATGGDRLRTMFAAGIEASVIQQLDIPMGSRLSGWVAATGQSMLNADPALEFAGTSLRSAVAVPVKDGESTAVITLYSLTPRAFDDSAIDLLSTIAPHAARTLGIAESDALGRQPAG